MKREELITSKEYIISEIQLKLLNLIEDYMKKNNLKRNELAQELKVTKGYVSQLLNVSYDHKLSKIVELSLSCNSMPLLYFVDLDRFIKDDAEDKIYELIPMMRPRLVSYEKKSYMVDGRTKKQRKIKDIPTTIVKNNQEHFSINL